MLFGLRVTSRCLKDDLAYGDDSADLLTAMEHGIVRDFVRTRSSEPDGTEGVIAALGVPFMKLKAGDRARGVTLWEKKPQGRDNIQDPALPFPGVVWLAGIGFRKEGDRGDAYEVFARLGPDRLMPTQMDYELLYADIHTATEEALRSDLARAMHELLERAWREPGRLQEQHIEIGDIAVGIVVFDYGEYRVAVLPLIDDRKHSVPEDILLLFARVVFGDECRLEELEPADPEILREIGYRPRPTDWALAQLREPSRARSQ